ncbi:MAG TPA: helix-turn-helix domain-containing protein [Myxococcota bacterium]|nr:helix-turn-helix domain-containing protein [Myxococcota bacterium]
MSTAALSRSERRRQETADRIADAAAHLFGERGFAATTVSDICERADVARQTFFNHFATKQEVAQEIARRGHDFFLEALETARREGADTAERLARLFASIHQAAAQVGPMHLDLVTEVARAAYETADPAQIGSLQRGVEKLLRTGRAQGDVSRRHALEDQAALVLGALQNLTFEWTRSVDFPIAERSARMARMLAEVLAP